MRFALVPEVKRFLATLNAALDASPTIKRGLVAILVGNTDVYCLAGWSLDSSDRGVLSLSTAAGNELYLEFTPEGFITTLDGAYSFQAFEPVADCRYDARTESFYDALIFETAPSYMRKTVVTALEELDRSGVTAQLLRAVSDADPWCVATYLKRSAAIGHGPGCTSLWSWKMGSGICQ